MSDEKPYALEFGGCWHAVAEQEGDRWTAVCGLEGKPYAGQPSSITRLVGPPSPLCCHHPAEAPAQLPAGVISLQQALTEFAAGAEAFRFHGTMEELAAYVEHANTAEDARLAEQGIVPVSVVHGDPETDEDGELIFGVLPRLAAESGPYCTTIGGNDYMTWHFCGPQAERDALAFISKADRVAAPWWNVTKTARPVFPGWGPPA